MHIKESKIAFICFLLFLRIGTFQWVTAEGNKKNPGSRLRLCAKRLKLSFHPFSSARALQGGVQIRRLGKDSM
jgi:hypothetical protein